MKERKGYIFQENGKWYARITATDESGKRRNIKRTALSKPDARRILGELRKALEIEGSQVVNYLGLTFNDLADYYETVHAVPAQIINGQKVSGMRGATNVRYYIAAFRKYFRNIPLREIDHSHLVSFRETRVETPTYKKTTRSITTVNRELANLRRMFSVAVQKSWITQNPFSRGHQLIFPSCEQRRQRILTADEEHRLLKACEDPRRIHLRLMLIALLDTGARKSEILQLRWADVDMENGLLTIRAENTKTFRERTIALTSRLRSELDLIWPQTGLETLIFTIRNVRSSFKTACRIAGIMHGGIDGLTLHSMRHTAATRLVKGQLPIQMIGRVLGHTQVNTTYRYLSADTETVREAAAILDAFRK